MERYEELLDRWQDYNDAMSAEEVDELFNMVYDHVEAGESLSEAELSVVMEGNAIDSEILEVGRKGWVEMRGIYEIRGHYYAIDYGYNDMCGCEYDEQILREVELKPVTRMDWVVKNPD